MTLATEDEVAGIVRDATAPLAVRGGGTRRIGRPVQGETLDLSGLSGIVTYDPGALTLVVKAGTPVADVEAALAKEGQALPFEPMDHRVLLGTEGMPTIGGMVAANVSGPRRIKVGACRDFLLGVRFVDGRGDVLKSGGRVMKNVTGYDLVRLMAGSWGTLGIVTEVALKVLPRAETEATLRIGGTDPERSVAAMSAALGSPWEVSGAARLPEGETVLRLEGFGDSVAYRTEALADALAHFGAVETLDAAKSRPLWQDVGNVRALSAAGRDVWRISVRPSEAPGVMARLEAEAVLMDWGGGLIWAALPEGTDARERMGDIRGHSTLVRASEEVRTRLPVFQPQPRKLALVMGGLRKKFDPRGILNPGLMG